MKLRNVCVLAFLTGLLVPSGTYAQNWATKQELDDLRTQLTERVDQLDASVSQIQKTLTQTAVQQKQNAADIATLLGVANSNAQVVGRVERDLQIAIKKVSEDTGLVRKQLNQISRVGPSGQTMLDFQMDTEPGRKALSDAIVVATPPTGVLIVDNQMSSSHRVRVNDGRVFDGYIAAGTAREFNVAVGTVTTELVGWEQPKNWTVGPSPSGYKQKVVIRPRTRTVTTFPPTVTTFPPIVTTFPPLDSIVYTTTNWWP